MPDNENSQPDFRRAAQLKQRLDELVPGNDATVDPVTGKLTVPAIPTRKPGRDKSEASSDSKPPKATSGTY